MREIKFRGKRIDTGEWVYGDLIENQGQYYIYHATSETTRVNEDNSILVLGVEVDPDTVGQYTGMKDYVGKEIYEGDVLLLSNKNTYQELIVVEHGPYGWVFYNPKTVLRFKDGSHTYRVVENYGLLFGFGEVVGNIHDNPELLEGGVL